MDTRSLGGCWENGERLGLQASLDWFIRRIVSRIGRNIHDKQSISTPADSRGTSYFYFYFSD